ncbi:VTC domain-containing protein [Candidatus Pelagibacter communis]|uniref:VTC domain-containing protein n=1 Tax=Pelagibacter ubique TaxID=198252 RepID=UPI00094CC66B|nr:VTC domain-containing protein [Candidatus Pelagibacter ubique]
MSFRIENKYEISIKRINNFFEFLKNKNAKQMYDKRKISSIYFDNKFKDSFHNSEEGVVPRKKIRLRYYGSENFNTLKELQLEEKINSYEGKYKTSRKVKNFKNFLKNGIHDDFYGNCKPIVLVNYTREYFSINKFRITFDKDIKYKIFGSKAFFKDVEQCIVEVKVKNIYLENEINNLFPFKKIRYSKYSNSIKLLKLDRR